MRINRNLSLVSVIVAVLCFLASLILYKYAGARAADYWRSILIGVLASSLVSVCISITSYLNIRNAHFFKANVLIMKMYIFFTSKLLYVEQYNAQNINRLKKIEAQYQEMIAITSDYHTFVRWGFRYRHIKRIRDLMMKLTDLAKTWTEAEYCEPEQYNELMQQTASFSEKYGNEFQDIVEAYRNYQSHK